MEYEIVVGLEVHVQLLTRTKLFCGCRTEFGLPPNTATCPVCLGLPGALPVINHRAVELALRAALALNCRIARSTKWDRKNYYYPDLPKNYQISQYDLPLSSDGWLEIDVATDPRRATQPKRVGIIRVHLEEDAGKLLHDESGQGAATRVDLNRAGTPLLEIVSRPEIHSPAEAVAYLQELRLLLREIGVSDCEMQEGSLRCDANVNVRVPTKDGVVATPIVEIKNLNSIRGLERAIDYEARRQFRAFHDPNDEAYGKRFGELPKATAGWLDDLGVTRVQRRKEEAADYRYFPDPDLMPVSVDEAWLAQIRDKMGELPAAQRRRLTQQYGLSHYDANVLVNQGRALVAYFEIVARAANDAKAACNWVTNQVLATLNERGQRIEQFPISAHLLGEMIAHIRSQGLNNQRARDVFQHLLQSGGSSVADAFAALGIREISETELREAVRRQLAAHPKAVADYQAGNPRAIDRIKGAIMKETGGMARMDVVQRLLDEELHRPT